MRDARLAPKDLWHRSDAERQERSERARRIGAEFAQMVPDREVLTAIHEAMRGLPYEDFEVAFVESLVGETREGWLRFILGRCQVSLENIDHLFPNRGDVLAGIGDAADEWDKWRVIEPWAIWDEHWPFVNLADYLFPRLLPQIDLRSWLDAMEGVRSPIWFKALVAASEGASDRNLLLRVMEEADSGFSSWQPSGKCVALVAAKWIVEHARKLDEATRRDARDDDTSTILELRHLREKELPAYFDAAFQKLLARTDGEPLALHLLAYLGEATLRHPATGFARNDQSLGFDVDILALDRLSLALRDRDVSLARFKKLDGRRDKAAKDWKSQKPEYATVSGLRRPERRVGSPAGEAERIRVSPALPVWIAAFARVYANEPPMPAELDELWSLLTMVLASRDPGLRLIRNDEHHSIRAIEWMAHVLVNAGNAIERWNDAFCALEPQRRRAQFAFRYGQYDEHESSWLLLRVGLQSCIRMPSERQAEREGLFFAVELATRRLWLICRQEIQFDWRMLYARCIATASTVFGAGTEGVLASLWKRVATSRWVVCASATLLLDQGVPVELLRNASNLAGIDLCSSLEAQRDWSSHGNEVEHPAGYDKLLEALRRPS